MSACLFLSIVCPSAVSCSGGGQPGPESGLPDARVITTGGNPDAGAGPGGDDDGPGGEVCPEGSWPCDEEAATPVCLSDEKFCDGTMDCANGYDESPEECVNPCAPDGGTATAWPCEDGTCLEDAKFCDGTLDCPDGSDEDPAECG